MGVLPQRFTGFRRAVSNSPRLGSTSSHQSFRLTRPAKEKLIGRTMPHGYVSGETKKKMLAIEKQISAAAGAGKKTFTDEHGKEHKITEEERYFAKEAREGGHTLTRKGEVNIFARGEVQTLREFGVPMKSGLNNPAEREAANIIVKEEEARLAPVERRRPQDDRIAHQKQLASIREKAHIGLPGSSQSTGSMAPTIAEVKPVQPITPGTAGAPGPTKVTTAGHAAGLAPTPMMVGGRHTDTDEHPGDPTLVAPSADPLTEQNQSAAESIPPAQDMDLPDTSNVDKGLPF